MALLPAFVVLEMNHETSQSSGNSSYSSVKEKTGKTSLLVTGNSKTPTEIPGSKMNQSILKDNQQCDNPKCSCKKCTCGGSCSCNDGKK
jgi:hypothetical protein